MKYRRAVGSSYSMVSVMKLMRLHAEFGFTHACDGDAMSIAIGVDEDEESECD